MPERRLVNKILNTSTITDIVGARLFPIKLPEGATLPAITYELSMDFAVNHATGSTSTSHCRIELSSWAEGPQGYPAVKALANVLKAALRGWSESTGTPTVSSCHYQSGEDAPEDPYDGQDTGRYRVIQEYLLWYS